MRTKMLYPGLCASLLLAGGAVLADDLSDARDRRFIERDGNRDGYLSQSEYGGHPGNFRALDQDRDGRLSRNEFVFRSRNVTDDDKVTTAGTTNAGLDAFERMDRNGDGIVSRGEWTGDAQTFNRLDRTNDGRVTQDEYRNPLPPDSPEGRLADKDRNNDGVLTRAEWGVESVPFDWVDRNRDGVVDLNEYQDLSADEGRNARFARMDGDRDGVVVRREWARGEFPGFDEVDRDNDGAVTLDEYLSPLSSNAGTFADLDLDGNGVLSRRELAVSATEWRRLDRNDDGVVNRTEYALLTPQTRTEPGRRFRDLDRNGDGVLSTNEWPDYRSFSLLDDNRDGRLSIYEFRDRNRMWEGVQGQDTDHDGRISRDEWRGSASSFRYFDRNGDGVVTRSELVG